MADAKLTGLAELTTLADEDLLYVVDDPSGAAASRKATVQNLAKRITSRVNVFEAGQRGEITTLVDGATIAIDMNDSNNFEVTLGGSRTLGAPSNAVQGQSGFILINNPSTHTLAYNAVYKFAGGSAPVVTENGISILPYYAYDTNLIVLGSILNVS